MKKGAPRQVHVNKMGDGRSAPSPLAKILAGTGNSQGQGHSQMLENRLCVASMDPTIKYFHEAHPQGFPISRSNRTLNLAALATVTYKTKVIPGQHAF